MCIYAKDLCLSLWTLHAKSLGITFTFFSQVFNSLNSHKILRVSIQHLVKLVWQLLKMLTTQIHNYHSANFYQKIPAQLSGGGNKFESGVQIKGDTQPRLENCIYAIKIGP